MKTVRIYEYSKCSTCRKALSFLDSHKIAYEKVLVIRVTRAFAGKSVRAHS